MDADSRVAVCISLALCQESLGLGMARYISACHGLMAWPDLGVQAGRFWNYAAQAYSRKISFVKAALLTRLVLVA